MARVKGSGRWSILIFLALVFLAHCGDKSTAPPQDPRQYEMTYLRDYEYLKRTYYSVGQTDADSAGIHFTPGQDRITEFRLYVPGSYDEPEDFFAIMVVEPRDLEAYPKNMFYGPVHQLAEGEDYFLDPDEFYIRLSEPLPSNQFLACAMRVQIPGSEIGVEIGSLDPNDSPRHLKMLRPTALYPGSPTWEYEWRNAYDIGVTGFVPGDIKVDIRLGSRGTEGADSNLNRQDDIPYLEFFGLDRYNNSGQGGPDGRIDCIAGTVDQELGHIFFPNCRPFDPRPDTCYSPSGPQANLAVKFPDLYATYHTSFVEHLSVYYIEVGVVIEEE